MSTKKVIIASLKGGVGKSTITANLADALCRAGNRVLMLDCDFGMRCLDIITGSENDVIYDLGDIYTGTADLEQTVLKVKNHPGLMLCAAPFGEENEPDCDSFLKIMEEAEKKLSPDFIFIDTPGGLSKSLEFAAPISDLALIVTTQAPSAIRAAERTASYLEKYGAAKRRLIINKYSLKDTVSGTFPGIINIIDKTGVKLWGVVPVDEMLSDAEEYGMLLSETVNINARAAFENISSRICGRTTPLFTGFKKFDRKKAMQS